MNEYVQQLPLSELVLTDSEKTNVRVSVDLLIKNGATYSNAIRLAKILLAAINHPIELTDSFLHDHPENNPKVYSSFEVFMAFYLLMLAGKASNLYYTQKEAESGICTTYSITCPCDKESCSLCVARYMEGKIANAKYENLPPYHVGCRCGLLFHR